MPESIRGQRAEHLGVSLGLQQKAFKGAQAKSEQVWRGGCWASTAHFPEKASSDQVRTPVRRGLPIKAEIERLSE